MNGAQGRYTLPVAKRGGSAFSALALLSAVLVAAGCGSGSDSDSASTPTVASSLQALEYDNGHPLAAPPDDTTTLDQENEVTRLVNAHRVARGLNALIDSGSIRDVARAHSKHMIVHRFFGHKAPEGLSARDRFLLAGLSDWTEVGENVAAGYASAQGVFRAWMDSDTHRQKIESDQWTHIGVGYAADPAPTLDYPETYYWTQNFLRP